MQHLFAVLYEDGRQEHVYSTSRCASTVCAILEELHGDEVPTIQQIKRLPVSINVKRPSVGVLMEVE